LEQLQGAQDDIQAFFGGLDLEGDRPLKELLPPNLDDFPLPDQKPVGDLDGRVGSVRRLRQPQRGGGDLGRQDEGGEERFPPDIPDLLSRPKAHMGGLLQFGEAI